METLSEQQNNINQQEQYNTYEPEIIMKDVNDSQTKINQKPSEQMSTPKKVLRNINGNCIAQVNQSKSKDKKRLGYNHPNTSSCKSSGQKMGFKQVSSSKERYQGTGEIVSNFFSQRGNYSRDNSAKKLKITKPQSPQLSTLMRSKLRDSLMQHQQESQQKSQQNSKKKCQLNRSGSKEFILRSDLRAREKSASKTNKENNMFDSQQQLSKSKLPHQPGVIPKYNLFVPQKQVHKQLEFKEFQLSTESRGQAKNQLLKSKLEYEQLQEEKSKYFQAQPIPDYQELAFQGINDKICQQNPTLPQNFNFHTDQRATLHTTASNMKDDQYQENSCIFKAKPMPDMRARTPIKPKAREVTIPQERLLTSDTRAQKRKEFDDHMKQKLEEQEKTKNQSNNQEDQDEQEQLKQFKAQPIKHYKEIQIQKSQKKATKAQSPKFQTDVRIQQRYNQSEYNDNMSEQQFFDIQSVQTEENNNQTIDNKEINTSEQLQQQEQLEQQQQKSQQQEYIEYQQQMKEQQQQQAIQNQQQSQNDSIKPREQSVIQELDEDDVVYEI